MTKKKLVVKVCKRANQEHLMSHRQYAHVGHRRGVICVAKAFFSLPLNFSMALIAHEVGHILSGYEGSEQEADRRANQFFGIKIGYIDSIHGKEFQHLWDKDASVVAAWEGFEYAPLT